MSKEEFHNVLTGAVTGRHEDVEQILKLCYENITRSQELNLDNKCFQQS